MCNTLFHHFLGWLLLDLIGLITFIKPFNEPKRWLNRIAFKSFMRKKYLLLSLSTELIGIILLISSFSVPWSYQLYVDINSGKFTRHFYANQAINLEALLNLLLFYVYYLGLALIFVKISVNLKIRKRTALELLELILIVPIILLIFNIHSVNCTPSPIPERFCLNSGYSSGFILLFIGTTVLIINGLQLSIYSRRKREIWMNK